MHEQNLDQTLKNMSRLAARIERNRWLEQHKHAIIAFTAVYCMLFSALAGLVLVIKTQNDRRDAAIYAAMQRTAPAATVVATTAKPVIVVAQAKPVVQARHALRVQARDPFAGIGGLSDNKPESVTKLNAPATGQFKKIVPFRTRRVHAPVKFVGTFDLKSGRLDAMSEDDLRRLDEDRRHFEESDRHFKAFAAKVDHQNQLHSDALAAEIHASNIDAHDYSGAIQDKVARALATSAKVAMESIDTQIDQDHYALR